MEIHRGIRSAMEAVANAANTVGKTLSAGAEAIGLRVNNQTPPATNDLKENLSKKNAETMQKAIDATDKHIAKTEAQQKRAEGFANAQKQWLAQNNGVDPYKKEDVKNTQSRSDNEIRQNIKISDANGKLDVDGEMTEYEEGIRLPQKPKKTSGEG